MYLKRIITHSGTFHMDDVFAVACLLFAQSEHLPVPEVVRTRTILPEHLEDPSIAVVDVGLQYQPELNNFDHHQRGGAFPAHSQRKAPVPYAAFGLVWQHHGLAVLSRVLRLDSTNIAHTAHLNRVFADVERSLVFYADALDNGALGQRQESPQCNGYYIRVPSLMEAVSAFQPFNPMAQSHEFDAGFMEAVKFAQRYLARMIQYNYDKQQAEALVHQAYNGGPLLVLDRNVVWPEAVSKLPEILYVISPRNDGHWNIQQANIQQPERITNDGKLPLPEAWRGLEGKPLQDITGEPKAVFCHSSGFLAVAATKEAAINLANASIALQQDSLHRVYINHDLYTICSNVKQAWGIINQLPAGTQHVVRDFAGNNVAECVPL